MKRNVGNLDKVIRILMVLTIVLLFFTHVITGTISVVLFALAGVLLATTLTGFCPLYLPLRINTDRKKE